MRTAIAIAAAMFALAACGGGGGETAPPQPPGMVQPQPPAPPAGGRCASSQSDICVDFMARPVFPWDNLGNPSWVRMPGAPEAVRDRSSNAAVIGPGVYGLELHDPGELDRAGAHGDYSLHYGRVDDGTAASTLAGLLTTNEAGAARAVKRWGDTPPTVQVATGTAAEQVAEARLIVKYINRALPRDWQLQWSDERFDAADPAAQGRIRMVFAPASTWPEAGHATLGLTQVKTSRGDILSAQIWLDPARTPHKTVRLKVIAHEMLHALGREHADPARFPKTILHSATDGTPAIPPSCIRSTMRPSWRSTAFWRPGRTRMASCRPSVPGKRRPAIWQRRSHSGSRAGSGSAPPNAMLWCAPGPSARPRRTFRSRRTRPSAGRQAGRAGWWGLPLLRNRLRAMRR